MTQAFHGFPNQTLTFLARLEKHNDREWFKAHRSDYEAFVLSPAREYVAAMGARLQSIVPGIQAIPTVDKSIFRMHRDTRFSADKRPFKTHIGIFIWEGDDNKLECPGFYLHLEKDKLRIGGGIHIFSKPLLTQYRAAVDDEKLGRRLVSVLKEGRRYFTDDRDSDTYKQIPRGYAKDHPRAELLKKKGLTFGETVSIPEVLHTPAVLDYVYERFERILPLHKWLREMKARD